MPATEDGLPVLAGLKAPRMARPVRGSALTPAARREDSRLSPVLATQITDVPAIIAFRNQPTHAYSAIDHRTVWGVLERRVPLLRSEVEPLLQSLQTD